MSFLIYSPLTGKHITNYIFNGDIVLWPTTRQKSIYYNRLTEFEFDIISNISVYFCISLKVFSWKIAQNRALLFGYGDLESEGNDLSKMVPAS